MAYEKHTWVDKEVITAEKLNNLEEGAAAKPVPGPQGERGPQGAQGPQGETGPKGDGFTGEPVVINTLQNEADNATVIKKINEIIGVLATRGVTKGA